MADNEAAANLVMSAVVQGVDSDVEAYRSGCGRFVVNLQGDRVFVVSVEDVTEEATHG